MVREQLGWVCRRVSLAVCGAHGWCLGFMGRVTFFIERSGFLVELSRCPPRGYQMSGLAPGFDF